MVDEWDPRCLGQKGDRARSSGIRFEHVELAAVQRELQVEQSACAECGGDRGGQLMDLGLQGRGYRGRRDDAGRVAGVNTGRLDMLEDAADPDRFAVAEDVDVELERACEELVHERGLVELELLRPAHDTHSAPAENVVGTHEHRIADSLGDGPRLRRRRRRSPGRGAQAEFAE